MYKSSLKNVKWKEFKIGGDDGLFEIANSTAYHKENLEEVNEGIPYVTRSSLNNGIDCFIFNRDFKLNPPNTISFGAENADFFYQRNAYATGNKMYNIQNSHINQYTGLFLVQALRQSIKNCGFGYGKGLTGTRLKDRKVMLPIDDDNKPNWSFMEEYVKERMNNKRRIIVDYYNNRLVDIIINNQLIKDVKWKAFCFSDLFQEIKRGKRLTKANQIEGKTPYVSSKSLNNGIDNYIEKNDNMRVFKDNISVANSGSVGSCFYHKYEYVASDHITALSLENGNENVYLFMSSIIKKLEEKYSFNREINNSRIEREKILLPVDDEGQPNWKYMSEFIDRIKHSDITRLIKYFEQYIYIYIN